MDGGCVDERFVNGGCVDEFGEMGDAPGIQ